MPVRRHSIDLPTANKETSTDRRRRRPSADIALAEPIVEGVIVPEGIATQRVGCWCTNSIKDHCPELQHC